MEWTDEQRHAFADLWVRSRETSGLKQYQVADQTGVSAGTISTLERGPYSGMRSIDLWRLQAFYGIPYITPPQLLGIDLADQTALEESPLATYVNRFAQLGSDDQKTVLEVLDVLIARFLKR